MWLKVLAHRGRHWTLLQNVSREMWNGTQLARVISHVPDKTSGGDIVSADELKSVLCWPVYVAADCLIDMLAQTEDQLNHLFQVSYSASILILIYLFISVWPSLRGGFKHCIPLVRMSVCPSVCLSVCPMPSIFSKSKSHRNFKFGGDMTLDTRNWEN